MDDLAELASKEGLSFSHLVPWSAAEDETLRAVRLARGAGKEWRLDLSACCPSAAASAWGTLRRPGVAWVHAQARVCHFVWPARVHRPTRFWWDLPT